MPVSLIMTVQPVPAEVFWALPMRILSKSFMEIIFVVCLLELIIIVTILTKNYFKVKQNGGTKKSQQSEKKENVLRYLIARTLSGSYNEHQDF